MPSAEIFPQLPVSCEWHERLDFLSSKPTHSRGPCKNLSKGGFIVYSEKFLPVLGSSPTISCILHNTNEPYFHEAGVYIPSTGEVYVTSNQLKKHGKKHIQISRIFKEPHSGRYNYDFVHTDISLPNGAVNYKDGILFCEQGTLDTSGGLTYMSLKDRAIEPIVTNYHGRWFNSVNDVVTHSDGSIWFTDPKYGYEQGIRPRPQLPNQVYRYDPKTGDIRVVAESFIKPNGLCFSPDEQTLYVTDTAGIQGKGDYDPSGAASIYAFDVILRHSSPFLMNRRLFAFADNGVPDGIKCDNAGNVYSGCGDGVHVWSPGAELIGKIYVPDGSCANFCFGKGGELFLLSEFKVWHVQLDGEVRGALLKI